MLNNAFFSFINGSEKESNPADKANKKWCFRITSKVFLERINLLYEQVNRNFFKAATLFSILTVLAIFIKDQDL